MRKENLVLTERSVCLKSSLEINSDRNPNSIKTDNYLDVAYIPAHQTKNSVLQKVT